MPVVHSTIDQNAMQTCVRSRVLDVGEELSVPSKAPIGQPSGHRICGWSHHRRSHHPCSNSSEAPTKRGVPMLAMAFAHVHGWGLLNMVPIIFYTHRSLCRDFFRINAY